MPWVQRMWYEIKASVAPTLCECFKKEDDIIRFEFLKSHLFLRQNIMQMVGYELWYAKKLFKGHLSGLISL